MGEGVTQRTHLLQGEAGEFLVSQSSLLCPTRLLGATLNIAYAIHPRRKTRTIESGIIKGSKTEGDVAVERRLPSWLKVRMPGGPNYIELMGLLRQENLRTVCEEAHCPNIGECWERGTATFMILGDICTRACSYCAVTTGAPTGLDLQEPARLAETVERMGLRYAVITSVNRDDLPDGGAFIFAQCISQVRKRLPGCKVEVLIPDFCGNWDALATVMAAAPDTLNHNIETAPEGVPQGQARGRLRSVAGAARQG